MGHARNPKTPFEFTDMSVKEPWDELWKSKCRARIKGCNGGVLLISKNTAAATGELLGNKVRLRGKRVHHADVDPTTSARLSHDLIKDKRINLWSWDNLESFVSKL